MANGQQMMVGGDVITAVDGQSISDVAGLPAKSHNSTY
jgi:hypothetical protein